MRLDKKHLLFITGLAGLMVLLWVLFPPVISGRDMEEKGPSSAIAAHWIFSKDYIQSGTITEKDLVMRDVSGNANHLRLINLEDSNQKIPSVRWSEEDYEQKDGVETLQFHHKKSDAGGQYFQTDKDAPLNHNRFKNGYTIEVLFKLPKQFSPKDHGGMGIMSRGGGRSTLSVSDFKQVQWASQPLNLQRSETDWSLALDSVENWYHVAVVNDGKHSSIYINGVADFRHSTDAEIFGIDVAKGKGWNIGASEKENKADALFSGNLQEIRIANRALPQEEWLIQQKAGDHVQNGSNHYQSLRTKKKNYSFLFVPDPQKTVRSKPEIFKEQMRWISKKYEKLNFAMTAFLGDMVDQSDSLEEWVHSSTSVGLLDQGKAPYVTIAGNHDYGKGNPYLKYYGSGRFKDKSYFKGASPTGYSSYSIIKAGSYHYLFLSLDMEHMKEDIPWAKKVLKAHPKTPTILLSHQILNIEGDTPIETERGTLAWDELVHPFNQVFMTVNGHHQGSTHRVKKNAAGNQVLQMLVDYQSSYHGGNGWMRFAEFDESDKVIRFKTYSPWVDKLPRPQKTYFDVAYLTGERDQFQIPFDFEERFDFGQ
ncbi:LamG-like jellyroll fold domain-containing protein [Rossellomorea sp. GCM10028870]|uniref:LamG-like jellyroll fold domain-containing protein n=1 Tax=Rossellomorea sp. GCM10028870 TaxID=3273426 RepID=UPI00360D5E11